MSNSIELPFRGNVVIPTDTGKWDQDIEKAFATHAVKYVVTQLNQFMDDHYDQFDFGDIAEIIEDRIAVIEDCYSIGEFPPETASLD